MTITASSLKKVYRGRAVVNDVSLNIGQGEVVGLLGPNGAGKTTTFYMIVGLVQPQAGRVTLDSTDITSLPIYHRARLGIGYLPQEPSVFRKLTVEDNLRLVLQMCHVKRVEQDKRLESLLSEFHIGHIRRSMSYVLSGGERRRVEIARSLASDPAFILLDEPFTGIDPRTIEELQEVIRHLQQRNIGVLITDHNVEATLAITDRSYILVDGKIVVEGTREAVLANDMARKRYFGSSFGRDMTAECTPAVVEFLAELHFPANRHGLLQQAHKRNAPENAVVFLESLPSNITFDSITELAEKHGSSD